MSDAVDDIDRQIALLKQSRAYSRYLSSKHVGLTAIDIPWTLGPEGSKATIEFPSPLTDDQIRGHNEVGHWHNQNFIVRLYAVLETHGLVSSTVKIDTSAPGHEDVQIVRWLRHRYGHGSGRYNSKDSDDRRLLNTMVARFTLNKAIFEDLGEFPVMINTVLLPLADGCKTYAKSKSA